MTTLLKHAKVGNGANLEGCLVGEGASVGDGCQLNGVVVDHASLVPANTVLSGGQWPRIDE